MTTPTDITNYVESIKKEYNISLKYVYNGFLLMDFIKDVEDMMVKYNVVLLDQDINRESYQTNDTLYYYHNNTKLMYKKGILVTIFVNPKPFITHNGLSLKKMFNDEYSNIKMPNIIYEDEYYVCGKVNSVNFKVRIPKIN